MLLERLHEKLVRGVRYSFSQEGEDMILARLFEGSPTGFYVDVGAHHPTRFSNTYYFYRRGWSGINIDAMPGSMKRFHSVRPRDINLEVPVSVGEEELDYFMFNEPALNSFDEELSRSREDDHYRIVETRKIKTRRLEALLQENLPEATQINFMSVDVEGLDLSVLKSNDWNLFRPSYLLVEILSGGADLDEIRADEISIYLESQGYAMHSRCVHTVIFRDSTHRGP